MRGGSEIRNQQQERFVAFWLGVDGRRALSWSKHGGEHKIVMLRGESFPAQMETSII
jgi:hypothetical protein